MKNVDEIISYENPVFQAYVFWSSVLILKMLVAAGLTSHQRMKNQVVINPEDVQFLKDKKTPTKYFDPDVERARRAHRNDLENCLPFIFITFLYLLTSPDQNLAINLIRASVIARIIHTIVYVVHPTQPARRIAWYVCYLATGFMGIKTTWHFM